MLLTDFVASQETECSEINNNINDIADLGQEDQEDSEYLAFSLEGLGYESMDEEDEYVSPTNVSLEALKLIAAQKSKYSQNGEVFGRVVELAEAIA